MNLEMGLPPSDALSLKRTDGRPARILFGSAHPYIPQMLGGAQSSTDELVKHLRARGHEVGVLAGLTGEGWTGVRGRLLLKLGQPYTRDDALGYPVFRAWFAWEAAAQVASDFKADIAIFQSRLPVRLAEAIDRQATRTFIYLRNAEIEDLGGRPGMLTDTGFIANSHFTARHYAQTEGLRAEVVYPLIDASKYKVQSTRRNVTFINPHPKKGLDIALAVAGLCPEIPFVFIRSWSLSEEEEKTLQHQVAKLPNVRLRPSTRDMKSVYGDAKIVLAPSRWEEAFGRIAAEAQVSGIPVVGSDRGGLPEAIGPGGVVVPIDAPAADWAEAVRRLWSDEVLYEQASRAALAHAARPEMDPDWQIDRLLGILGSDLARQESRKAEVNNGS
jgi:glycosyltransferase involved in cell wall biosynthesis